MNALSELLNLPDSEKKTRGLVHTPAEIAQQPNPNWLQKTPMMEEQQPERKSDLAASIDEIKRRMLGRAAA